MKTRQLMIHSSVVALLVATINRALPSADASEGCCAFDASELEEGQLGTGHIAIGADSENSVLSTSSNECLDCVVIIGRFNGRFQTLTSRKSDDKGFHTFELHGDASFLEFIQTDGYIASINMLQDYLTMFELGEELSAVLRQCVIGELDMAKATQTLVVLRKDDEEVGKLPAETVKHYPRMDPTWDDVAKARSQSAQEAPSAVVEEVPTTDTVDTETAADDDRGAPVAPSTKSRRWIVPVVGVVGVVALAAAALVLRRA